MRKGRGRRKIKIRMDANSGGERKREASVATIFKMI
jgi:hypothetical protein